MWEKCRNEADQARRTVGPRAQWQGHKQVLKIPKVNKETVQNILRSYFMKQ